MADKYKDLLEELSNKFNPVAPPAVVPEVTPESDPEVIPPEGKYSSVLEELNKQFGKAAATPDLPSEVTPLSNEVYSENDLVQDRYFLPIQKYMVERFGEHMRKADREDLVEKFTNNMRGFEGGNSVRTINETVFLNEVSDDENRMATVGEAYEIYQGMQSVFGDTTVGEKVETVWDFAKSTIADPINLLGLGISKVATGTGFRAGSQGVMIAAKKAYQKKLLSGASKEEALEFGQRVFTRQARVATAKTNAKIAQRQAVEQGAKTTLQRMTTSIALKEAAILGTFEASVSAGTDYLYQDAMLRTKVQEEYNIYQTGLSAVIGLVAGGIAGATSNVGTGASGLKAPPVLITTTKDNKTLGKLVKQDPIATTPDLKEGNWLADIAKGKELNDQDNEFFVTMLLGNDEKGLKGLAQIAVEEGYTWVRRSPEDKVSNWIGDLIKQADPQDAKQFLKDFTKVTGISMAQGKKLTVEALADTFKKKMSDSAKTLNAAKQISDVLGGNLKGRTVGDYIEAVVDGGVAEVTSTTQDAIGKFTNDLINRDLPDLQNSIIRLLVANPSTTAMNVTGFAAMTGLNSATDITRAILLGGKAGLYLAYKPQAAKEAGITALGILQNQKLKAQSILDINTTYDQYLKYTQARPQAMKKLTAVLSGGVESADKSVKGFNPDTPLLTLRTNQAVDVVQSAALGNAQDGLTKSIEFMSQMDKLMRRPRSEGGYGMSYNEFFSNTNLQNTNAAAKMMSERYVKLEAKAVDETLKAVFGKSYKGQGFLGEVAGIIEDARSIPGIGLLVPFGRFFNNTVALAYETTAIGPLISRMGGKTDKPYSETVIRGAVTWSLIYALAERELGYIDQGLGWSEEIDEETGAVVDEKYEFPYGLYKAIGRTLAHRMRGEGIPEELGVQFADQFGVGQLTRQLGDAGSGLGNIATALLSEEGPDLTKALQEAMGGIVSQAVSGVTRPLEPVNAVIGLARDEEFYVPDRKQGSKTFNNAFRYMDQAVALFTGGNTMPPAYSAAEGKPRQNVSKLVSTTRESRLTATEQVMNAIGRPSWKAGMASQSEAADNRYNQLFNQLVDEGAKKLWSSEAFKKGDLEYKQMMVNDLLQKSVKSTKNYMGSVAAKGGDRALLKMLNISNKPRLTVQRVLKDLQIDKGLDELSEEELDVLERAIKFREDTVKRKNE